MLEFQWQSGQFTDSFDDAALHGKRFRKQPKQIDGDVHYRRTGLAEALFQDRKHVVAQVVAFRLHVQELGVMKTGRDLQTAAGMGGIVSRLPPFK